ncbi:GNAT family N-acetyltransferase [Zhihengliuella sp.]|uniref:GNAT family N-acetyltransferase n=1 Tax=Zhihengliuella sp. TaxID=1954483 RepID=UPI00281207F1|nr:GNAT family N-acetyltransferase [Zhihengliuella sp.]
MRRDDRTVPQDDRLLFEPVAAEHVDDLFELHSDPALWEHYPEGRHDDVQQTGALVEAGMADWQRDGLGYWVVRSASTREVLGIGGVAKKLPGFWNLYYRFGSAHQGRGYATETARLAVAAAEEADAGAPVVASLLHHNEASRRVVEKLGFHLIQTGPDRADPSATRCRYADRRLDVPTLDRLLAGGR